MHDLIVTLRSLSQGTGFFELALRPPQPGARQARRDGGRAPPGGAGVLSACLPARSGPRLMTQATGASVLPRARALTSSPEPSGAEDASPAAVPRLRLSERMPHGMVRCEASRLMTLAATASGADLPLREHVLRTLRLAGPVMLARAGLLVMISVDTIMCGRVAAAELAYYGIALAPHLGFVLVGIGLLMGTVVVTAQTDGAGRPAECGRIWRLGYCSTALLFGSLFGLLLLPGEAILARARARRRRSRRAAAPCWSMFALGMPRDADVRRDHVLPRGDRPPDPRHGGHGDRQSGQFRPQLRADVRAVADGRRRRRARHLDHPLVHVPGARRLRARDARSRPLRRGRADGRALESGAQARPPGLADRRVVRPRARGVLRRRHLRRLARRRAARRLPDRAQHHGADLHAGDRPRDRDGGPGRQCRRPSRPARPRQGGLGRARPRRSRSCSA